MLCFQSFLATFTADASCTKQLGCCDLGAQLELEPEGLAPPRCPQHCLSASLGPADHSGRVTLHKPLSGSAPLVNKIRTRSAVERSLVSESILCCIQQHGQVGL